ncbi:serine/threonine-protein kinase [Oryzobacter sp. R7]|uniref:serine/threonine-protein kinase n=1 Tax=Oryzobacter faecalis TaxID=3388656 RepID=UPI00398D250F
MPESDVIAGRYRTLRPIGAGGMGVVWLAHDERLGRDVAVKRLHARATAADEDARVASQRALREARITARLHHPHAVGVFDVVEHEGQPCLVMEYVPSTSLAELAATAGGPDVAEVARIGAEVASALAAAHELGIVHRDVKPANVLIAPDGTARISDFGIAHALGDASLTSTGLVTGTPAYLAPEVARGERSTPASDVFSLGATLYTVLEGEPPFGTHENAMAVLHRVASGHVRAPRASGRLTPLLTDMLAPSPAARPAMAEVAAALSDVAALAAAADPAADGPAAAAGVAAATVPVEEGDLLAGFREEGPATTAPEVPVRRRRGRLLVVLASLLVAAGVWALVAQRADEPRASGPTSTPAPTRSSPAVSPTTSPPTSPTATATPSPTPSPSRTPARSPDPSGGAPSAGQLSTALRDYYALLPGDVDAGYALLTDRYRRTTAGSRASYAAFWSDIERVRVSRVGATAPDAVTATLTYDFADGRTVVERTSYRLVRDDGVLKIDRSSVLSSTGG